MTQYNTLNVKLPNSQLNKLKSGIKNDGARGTYNTNSQIKFKTLMLKSSLYDYSDAYILVKETKARNFKCCW